MIDPFMRSGVSLNCQGQAKQTDLGFVVGLLLIDRGEQFKLHWRTGFSVLNWKGLKPDMIRGCLVTALLLNS